MLPWHKIPLNLIQIAAVKPGNHAFNAKHQIPAALLPCLLFTSKGNFKCLLCLNARFWLVSTSANSYIEKVLQCFCSCNNSKAKQKLHVGFHVTWPSWLNPWIYLGSGTDTRNKTQGAPSKGCIWISVTLPGDWTQNPPSHDIYQGSLLTSVLSFFLSFLLSLFQRCRFSFFSTETIPIGSVAAKHKAHVINLWCRPYNPFRSVCFKAS